MVGKWRPPLSSYWSLALPLPAHLRENTDLCSGSSGTKCFQIKIIFPRALLACFIQLWIWQGPSPSQRFLFPSFPSLQQPGSFRSGYLVFLPHFLFHFSLCCIFLQPIITVQNRSLPAVLTAVWTKPSMSLIRLHLTFLNFWNGGRKVVSLSSRDVNLHQKSVLNVHQSFKTGSSSLVLLLRLH